MSKELKLYILIIVLICYLVLVLLKEWGAMLGSLFGMIVASALIWIGIKFFDR